MPPKPKKSARCERLIKIGGEDRVVKQTWRQTRTGYTLTSVLLDKGTQRSRGASIAEFVAGNDELVAVGKQHAETIRERAESSRRQHPSAAATGVKRTRVNADLEVAASDPVQAAITSGPRGGEAAPRPAKAPRKPTRVEKRRADVLEMVRKDPVLEEEMRTMLGVQGLEGVAAVHAENTRAMAASLAALKGKSQSNIGRVAYTTVLAAVAGAGEHTCSPTDPCNPAERCPPAEPQGGVSFAQRAESLGVREKTFRAAHVRMHHTDHAIPPPQALEEGRYCWTTRKTRSDATDERVLELAIRFWHCDDVSRVSGDSGDKAMWRQSKKAGEEYHPRRQLMVAGDKVFCMFLDWPQYVALKKELLEEDPSFEDPGRTTFLSTRCGCLVDPKVSQCACMIHTQQKLYLDALRFLMAAIHANCDCTCSWCEGGGCQKWAGMCKSLHAFSEELACPKVDLLAGDASGGFEFWGRKPACVAGTCAECGFGKPNGIPTDCQAFASHAERTVGWIRFMDQKMSDGTVHSKQELPQSGKLSELWEEFMAHSKVYMGHHELAKWQRQAHNMCMSTFPHGSLLIETDFIEKYKHEASAILTCSTAPSTTIMVALVHHSPQENGRHTTEAWVFLSEDKNHDFDFHVYAMDIILKYYTEGEGKAATAGTPVPTVHMFTDGCGKQYKGKRNFRTVAESLNRLGVFLVHNFAVTSHFKGAHDGIGGLLKALMREAEKRGFRIHDTAAAHDFLSAYAKSKEEDGGGCLGKWSPYKIANFKMELIRANEIPRPRVDLTGIPGSSKLYQFMGAENQDQRLRSSLGVEPADTRVVVAAGDEHANPGAEVVGPAPRPEKVTRKYTCRVRRASCYCSKCRVGAYPDCMVAKNYPEIVGKVHEKSGKERVVLAADS